MFRSFFSSRSSSRSPSPVSTSSTSSISDLSFTSRSSSPFSSSASLSKPLPPPHDADLDLSSPAPSAVPLPGAAGSHLPVPSLAVSTIKTILLPKNKISTHRLHQLTILLTVLNLTIFSLQREQDIMGSILQAATTATTASLEVRTPHPDSQDIDLLALAANACRARRYRAEDPTSLDAVGPWQGVVDDLGRDIKRLEAEVEELERERMFLEESW